MIASLIRYVYNANRGDEQLFNLTADPKETTDLAPNTAVEPVLASGRQRMVTQVSAASDGLGMTSDVLNDAGECRLGKPRMATDGLSE